MVFWLSLDGCSGFVGEVIFSGNQAAKVLAISVKVVSKCFYGPVGIRKQSRSCERTVLNNENELFIIINGLVAAGTRPLRFKV